MHRSESPGIVPPDFKCSVYRIAKTGRQLAISGYHFVKASARKLRGVVMSKKWLQGNPVTGSLSAAITAVVLIAATALSFALQMSPPPAQRYPVEETLAARADRQLLLYAADGTAFAERGGCVDRPVKRREIPEHFLAALLSMEDRRFFEHIGIDLVGIARAARENYRAGRVVQGGSTLTQQLAKMTYLSSVRTLDRKLEEALIALKLELILTKDQILERYLNQAYFGQGCYGLRAAAKRYFGKDVGDIGLLESAYLVALIPSPAIYSTDPQRALERMQLVLRAMEETGYDVRREIENIRVPNTTEASRSERAGYFADWIAHSVKQVKFSARDAAPVQVRTTLDLDLQALAEESVSKVLSKFGKRHRAGEAALVAMRPDGRVLAMVGGRDYEKSKFNRAFQAMRQPGSSFKTFVYLAALRAGLDTGIRVIDEPLSIDGYEPKNYGHGYRGAVSVTQAFASSINTVAVRISETAGRRRVIEAARDLGLSTPLTPTPSLALGASEVTLLELTSAYAAIAANAYPVRPWGVADLKGAGRFGGIPDGSGQWRLERGNDLKSLLAATVQFGTGTGANVPGATYGKTGTSQDYRDAWFIGFSGNLVVGVWLGNDDNSSMRGVTGGSLPAMIWRDFVRKAQKSDAGYDRRFRGVQAFRAMPRRDRNFHVAWNTLQYSDEFPMRYAGGADFGGGAYFWGASGPRPSLVGPGYGRPEPRRRSRTRSRGTFCPFESLCR